MNKAERKEIQKITKLSKSSKSFNKYMAVTITGAVIYSLLVLGWWLMWRNYKF